jgi:hypothetical protein
MLTDLQLSSLAVNPTMSLNTISRPHRHGGALHGSHVLLLLACLLAATPGCGDRDKYLDTHPTHGTATFQGKPMEHAIVTLYPVGGEPKTRQVLPHGEAGSDGVFQLWTYKVGDGVPSGEYRVTVTWPNRPTADIGMPGYVADQLDGRFASVDKSELRVSIKEGDNTLPPIELQ